MLSLRFIRETTGSNPVVSATDTIRMTSFRFITCRTCFQPISWNTRTTFHMTRRAPSNSSLSSKSHKYLAFTRLQVATKQACVHYKIQESTNSSMIHRRIPYNRWNIRHIPIRGLVQRRWRSARARRIHAPSFFYNWYVGQHTMNGQVPFIPKNTSASIIQFLKSNVIGVELLPFRRGRRCIFVPHPCYPRRRMKQRMRKVDPYKGRNSNTYVSATLTRLMERKVHKVKPWWAG